MELGFTRQELINAFSKALESSIRDIAIIQEHTSATLLGEYPSEEKALNEAMAKFEGFTANELLPIFIFALLKVIKANNDRIAEQIQSYIFSNKRNIFLFLEVFGLLIMKFPFKLVLLAIILPISFII